MHRKPPLAPIQSVFVLGGSSAVATAICLELANRGCRRFHLVARQLERQHTLVQKLRSFDRCDVTEEFADLTVDAGFQSPHSLPRVNDFDLYLIAAGSLRQIDLAWSDPASVCQITAVNYTGLIPWILAIATPDRLMQPRRLWVFSSVAADRGRPSNAAYGAAKAALTRFCEGLYLRCHALPFVVRVIKAGYMATPMAAGSPPALTVSAHSVACSLLREPNRRGIHYLPSWWGLLMLVVRLLPARLAAKL